jgi:hypothetical protein
MRRRYVLIIVATLGCMIALPIAWYLGSPLFINRTVDEALPVAAAAPRPVATSAMVADSTTRPPLQRATATAQPAVTATSQPARTATSQPMERMENLEVAVSPTSTATPAPLPTEELTPTMVLPTEVPPTPVPPEPVVLKRGQFHPVEHRGAGDAIIYQLADGTHILRLEDFDVLNGPDLYVYLSRAEDAHDEAPILDHGFVSLGRLKGNQGNQNYPLPADLDPGQFHSVSIWCQRFTVNFATAPLR